MDWTAERTALATKMWVEDGRSAGEIAAVLGDGATRNSVLGKLHRLKLVGGSQSPAGATAKVARQGGRGSKGSPNVAGILKRAARRAGEADRTPRKTPAFEASPDADLAPLLGDAWSPLAGREPVPIEALARHGQCRWPIGEVGEPGFGFCGAESDGTYCRTHARRATAGPGRSPALPPSAARVKDRPAGRVFG